jgi:hypothetical protein
LSVGTVTTGAAGSNASASITGTAPNQTLSLTIPRGNTGETGATGAAGPANSLSIGTVTTGAAGSSASATITGTAPNQTLSLTIPRGDTGAQGVTWTTAPESPTSTGTAGAMAYDANNFYVCVASNTWKRASLSTFTATDPNFSSVSLLLHMDGSGNTFVDSSGTPKTITAFGNATQSTAQSRFGGKSGYFDGPGSPGAHLTVSNSSGLALGTGDFTIELWIYFPDQSARAAGAWLVFTRGGSPLFIVMDESGNGFAHVRRDGGTTIATSSVIPVAQWVHLAAVRQSGSLRVYVNGVGGVSGASPDDFTQESVALFAFPNFSHQQNALRGYIDDLRITKGVARYTANFTPPTAAFPDA